MAKPPRFLYIDSSVLVSLALQDPTRAEQILNHRESFDQTVTSEISVVECQSGLAHQLEKNPSALLDAEQNLNRILGTMTLYSVSSLVLGHARSLVKQYRTSIGLRTLDGIHIATANLIQKALTSSAGQIETITADRRQHQVFTVEGFIGTLLS